MLNSRVRLYLAFLILALVVTILTTRVKTDISAFVVSGDNAEELLLANEMQAGALSRRIIVSVSALDDKTIPPNFMDELIRGLSGIPGVVDVWRSEQSRVAEQAIQSVYARYGPNLYSLDPESDLPRLLSAESLERRAGMLKQALLSPQASRIKKIALVDPLLLDLIVIR